MFSQSKKTKLIKMLETCIQEFHAMAYIESRTLFEVSEIIEFEEESLSIKLKNIKYCVLDYGDELFSQIPSSISHEVSEYTFEWSDIQELRNLAIPNDIECHDDKLMIYQLDWDDPKIPKEVIKNLGPIDFVELGSDLEESYEHLDSIDYADFPKSLLPIIKRAIEEYRNYKTE